MSQRRRGPSRESLPSPDRGALWRPGRLFGPGLVFAAVMAGLVLARGGLPPRPDVERPTVADARPLPPAPSDVGLVPEPAWLARRGAEIPLTPAQLANAKRAADAWERDTAAQRRALDQAAGELDDYLTERAAQGSLRGDEARRRGQTLSELSADLAARRQAAWDEAWADLSEAQRDKIRAMRGAAPLEMR